jgi:uncharacterized membrane protein
LGQRALKHPISRQLHDERTFGERLADAAAEQIGSWRFIVIQSIAVSIWIVINVVAIVKAWDPYPFSLLNLLFSVQAAYIGPVLLLSTNRAAQRDRVISDHGNVTNENAEQFIEGMMSELLRNSQATLAIARHLNVEVQALDEHRKSLDEKMDDVQGQLVEVEDVVKEVREREDVKVSSLGEEQK